MKKLLTSILVVLMATSLGAQNVPEGWIALTDQTPPTAIASIDLELAVEAVNAMGGYDNYFIYTKKSEGGTSYYFDMAYIEDVGEGDDGEEEYSLEFKYNISYNELIQMLAYYPIYYYPAIPTVSIEDLVVGDYGGKVITTGTVTFNNPYLSVIQDGQYGVAVQLEEKNDELHIGDRVILAGYYKDDMLDEAIVQFAEPGEPIVPAVVDVQDLFEPNAAKCRLVRVLDIGIVDAYINQGFYMTILEENILAFFMPEDVYAIGDRIDLTAVAFNDGGTLYLYTLPEWVEHHKETALDAVVNDQEVLKSLKDGKLIIRIGDRLYDATGTEL